ncbi:peptide chain release factor 1 [Acidipropionibacterium jensenii]|uniref:Peptide chain release factor 1 n=2 Tax=Acidipropionibacterium jensenii TaxID=1749 RepID=A0A3Q9UMA8_9ACTN|nr:peptide chain release factor 1 [Acidipropionibacterium jensenii]AZZ40732.1 peptide chain release factor 1 [Acidipropionibacterium jensenii]AZZ43331.1 peptide chain release factor 1 [Acidipropionibacterium jensenii]
MAEHEVVDQMRTRRSEIDSALSTPSVIADPSAVRRLSRERARLSRVLSHADAVSALADDTAAAAELAAEDDSFAAEHDRLAADLARGRAELTELLIPSDPIDDEDALLEIHSGEGGEESALFAADLLRMYQHYGESLGWRLEILDAQLTDLGGYRSVTVAVRGTADRPAYGTLKFEAGVHRVQRIPVTESQGRVHTSAVGVLVMPDVDAGQVDLDPADIRVDVFRSSGPGGQGVNTTDSAVRLTHIPTGIVVSCQNERSQLQNKEQAMRLLRANLMALAAEEAADESTRMRREQVRSVDRSARIRTYNFPENRLTDHRIGFKSHRLDEILNGRLDELEAALHADEISRRMAAVGRENR